MLRTDILPLHRISLRSSHAVVATLAVFLSACGGGDEGGSQTAPATAATSADAVAAANGRPPSTGAAATGTATAREFPCFTVTAEPAPVSDPTAPAILPIRGAAGVTDYRVLGEPESAGLCYANYRRMQVGLPALRTDDAIGKAARNHSQYMLWNKTLGHNEDTALRGFTGATPDARVQALYPTNATAEVVAGASKWSSDANASLALSSSDIMVADLIDAPFHRATLLGSYGAAGSGYAEEKTVSGGANAAFYQTVNLADATMPAPPTQMVAYPYAGQADVPASWVNNESPNPAPGYEGKTLGYPVTIQAVDRNRSLLADTFVLTDRQGNNVSCLKVDARSAAMAGAARGLAMCTPVVALQPRTEYQVAVSGTLGGAPLAVRWSFVTR